MRRRDRSRLVYPLLLSIVLWAVYWTLSRDPKVIPAFGDLRLIFGHDLAILNFAAYVPLILLLVRCFDFLAFDLMMSRRRQVSIPPLLRDIVALLLYVALFGAVVHELFGFNPAAILGYSAVLAAVLGLAAQDTLGNLFAGIALNLEDAFAGGDVIRSGDHIGRVENVNWRSTWIRTFNNDLVLIPNSVLSRERLEVFPAENPNGRVISVGIDYHVPPAQAIDVLRRAAAHVDGVSREMPCFARVASFNDSAVTYEIKYFVRDYMLRDRIDADIRRAVWYAMRRNGLSIPFPIRAFQPYTPPEHDHGASLDQETIVDRLRGVDLLAPLSESSLEAIADAAVAHVYSKGESIITHGVNGSSMFIVHSGSVSVRIPQDDEPEPREVAQLREGSVVGEMALLTGEVRSADVIAASDVVTIEIDKVALQPILLAHPDLAGAISAKVAERRRHLEEINAEDEAAEELTLSTRIRAYFGL